MIKALQKDFNVNTITMVVIVMGLPGSGKSYFAFRLAAAIRADYINSDRVRKQMIAKRTYSIKEKLSVYNEMLAQMLQAVKQKKHVVLDATFYKHSIRKKFIHEARKAGGIIFIEVRAGESLIQERLKQTRKDSEADFKVYKIIQAQWEPLQEEHLILQSTNDNINEMLLTTIDYLHLKNDKRTN
jgi:predicted kinase